MELRRTQCLIDKKKKRAIEEWNYPINKASKYTSLEILKADTRKCITKKEGREIINIGATQGLKGYTKKAKTNYLMKLII